MLAKDGLNVIKAPDPIIGQQEYVVTGVGWDTRSNTLVLNCKEAGKLTPAENEDYPEVHFDE